MLLKIKCTDAVGQALIRMFALIEVVATDYKPEDLQFEVCEDKLEREGKSGPRTQYWAKLPILPDGKFDMASVDVTVKKNLTDLGAATVNGIIYSDIVKKTIDREHPITEPALATARMMKRGSSQRAVQVLYNMGLIDRGPIARDE